MQAETSYPSVLGRILEQMRKDKGLDQHKFAEQIGLTQSAWSRIERGQSGVSMEQLINIGRVFGRQPGEIISEADRAVEGLKKQGVIVHPNIIKKFDNGLAMLGLAALGVMILAILSKK